MLESNNMLNQRPNRGFVNSSCQGNMQQNTNGPNLNVIIGHNCVRRGRTLPNAVEIDILGIFEGYSSLQIWPPQKIFQGRNYSGRMT